MMQPKGTQFRDISGNALPSQHNVARSSSAGELEEGYQKDMVNESGPRQLNSMQNPVGHERYGYEGPRIESPNFDRDDGL